MADLLKPTSEEDICNLVLDLLKQSPIASIHTPVTSTEFIFARWYTTVRQAALRSHPWKFATKRSLLTPNLSTTPPFGYTYAYDIPSDFIRMITIGDDYLGDLKTERVLENGQILTPSGSNANMDPDNPTTLYLRYVYDCIEVGKFDALFVSYFTTRFALRLVSKFAISAALKKELQEDYLDISSEARAVNGQDAPIKRIQNSKLLTKRRGLP